MADQLFGGTRVVQCKACREPHLARDMPIGLCRSCIEYIVTETPAAKRRAARPIDERRAAWFTAHRTSVAQQVSKPTLFDRLVVRAVLGVYRGIVWVGQKWREP